MPRVSQETMEKLNDFFDTRPTEDRNTCALCNETFTHIVKSAEAHTGAPTATMTKKLANRVNDGAASGDVVSGEALQDRVRRNEGVKVAGRQNQPELVYLKIGLGHNIGHSVGWVERSETQQRICVGFRSSTQPTGNWDGLKYDQGLKIRF